MSNENQEKIFRTSVVNSTVERIQEELNNKYKEYIFGFVYKIIDENFLFTKEYIMNILKEQKINDIRIYEDIIECLEKLGYNFINRKES